MVFVGELFVGECLSVDGVGELFVGAWKQPVLTLTRTLVQLCESVARRTYLQTSTTD